MTKKPGQYAYDHYLATGSIPSLFHVGVKRQGDGPPASPLTFERFLEVAREIPDAPREGTPEYTAWRKQGYRLNKRVRGRFER